MPTQQNSRSLLPRALAVSVALIAAAAAFATPARADAIDDSFLSALDGAGIGHQDPGSTAELGKSICPMLQQPGQTFASVASGVAGDKGMSPMMAHLFTGIAIRMYCPSTVDSLAEGEMPNLPGLPGLPGL